MSNRTIRIIMRYTHLVEGVLIALFIYSPTLQGHAGFATFIQFVVMPTIIISGLVMWQLPRISRWRRGTDAFKPTKLNLKLYGLWESLMKKNFEDLCEISLKNVNVHLISADTALILIDVGSAGSETAIFDAICHIGHQPADLTHIVVTHCHPDHAGSLAAIQAETNALTLMHPLDADMVRQGRAMRPLKPAPGWLTWLLFRSNGRGWGRAAVGGWPARYPCAGAQRRAGGLAVGVAWGSVRR